MKEKRKHNKDNFSASEVGTLIDRFQSNLTLFGEKQDSMSQKLDATYEQVGKNTELLTLLEITVKNLVTSIKELTKKVDKNTEAISRLTESIDNLVKTKADREDFHTLEIRVAALETKIASLK